MGLKSHRQRAGISCIRGWVFVRGDSHTQRGKGMHIQRLAERYWVSALMLALMIGTTASSPVAQQITGTPGAPSATMTINGEQLPAPPPKFEGVIQDTAPQSKPYWPPRIV